mgnify:CR=1 FL=1
MIVEKSSLLKRTFLVKFVGITKYMKIIDYYSELKSADYLMSSNLHHKLSTVLSNIINLVKDSKHTEDLKEFYKRLKELPFAEKGSDEYLEVRRINCEVLEYLEENLI